MNRSYSVIARVSEKDRLSAYALYISTSLSPRAKHVPRHVSNRQLSPPHEGLIHAQALQGRYRERYTVRPFLGESLHIKSSCVSVPEFSVLRRPSELDVEQAISPMRGNSRSRCNKSCTHAYLCLSTLLILRY